MPTEQIAPFGSPEGSRAAIDEIQNEFISFGDPSDWGGIAMKSDDLTVRVIVGKKGAGKTVYLRRLQAFAAAQESLYADETEFDTALPTTESVIRIKEMYPYTPNIAEKWMQIWYAAILRSLVSHLLHEPKLSGFIADDKAAFLVENFKPLYRKFGAPLTIYSQVSELLNNPQYHTAHKLDEYLSHYLWAELEYYLGEILKNSPPICFYIDAVDDQFEAAPIYWLKCQEGLFHQTMRFLRHPKLGGRLHISICIRDIVLSSIYRSEHQTKYYAEPHIRILSWNKNSISYFLEEKVARLHSKYFLGNLDKGKTLQSWLGVKEIKNISRNRKEPIEQYLLRHTRLLPRDIITLGNVLCNEIASSRLQAASASHEDLIRRTVANAASKFGNEQLRICASQIASTFLPQNAVKQRYASAYIGYEVYATSITTELKEILRLVGKDRFNYTDLEKMEQAASSKWEHHRNLFSVLWQNGLLGFTDGNRHPVFFSEEADFNVPRGKDAYVLHSCLIDTVGLKAIGEEPVINY